MAHFSKILDDLGRTFGRCSDLGKSAIPTANRRIWRQGDDLNLVYFMYSAGLVKIGYSTDIHKRLNELQNSAGAPVTLVAVISGDKDLEKFLHRTFKADRKHGEWFYPSSEIKRFLTCLDEATEAMVPPDIFPQIGSCVARLEAASNANQ